MPYDRARLNRYKFFHDGGRVDQAFIEDILLPGLSTQSRFARSSPGVELPHVVSDPAEFIPLKDAAELALDWFEEHQNLERDEVRNIEGLIGKSSYRQISDTLELILRKRVQDPQKLLKSRLVQNVAEMQHVKDLAKIEEKSKATYHPASNLLALSHLQIEITRLANLGISPSYINRLIPKSLTSTVGTLTQQRLINIVVSNPKLLKVASLHPESHELATQALTDELNKILYQYPDAAGLVNFTGTNEFREGLYGLTTHLNDQLAQSKISVDDYEDLVLKASYDLPHLLPNQSLLLDQIARLNTFSSAEHKMVFARTLMGVVVSSSGQALTAEQIIDLAGQQLGLPSAQINTLHTTLQSAGVLSAIEYKQNELHFGISARRLTTSERELIKKGVNPFHAHFEMGNLLAEAGKILALPKINASDAQIKIRQLYDGQLSSTNPSPVELSRLRGWLDRFDTIVYLDLKDNASLKRLAGRSRTERWLADANNRFRTAETSFYDKWFKIEQALPWNSIPRKLFEWYDKIAEKTHIPGTKIPVFRMVPWAFDQWDKLKKITTLKAYASLGKSWGFANPIRNSLRFTLRQYSLGGYTVDGAIFRYSHKLWGKTLTWAITKAGVPSLIKYPTTYAARFLIKIGGKTLAKFGLKAITALAAAATAIGSILSVAFAISLVFDVLKLGFDVIKKFIQDINFRKTIIKWSAAIGAVFTAVNFTRLFGVLWFISGGLFAAGLATLMTTLIVVGVALFAVPQIQNNIQSSMELDSGTSELLANSSTTIDCFVFEASGQPFPKNDVQTGSEPTEGWSAGEIEIMKGAIESMKSSYGNFIEAVCAGGDISLWRDASAPSVTWGGWAMSGDDIRIYNNGVSSALYTLSHELGHIYAARVGGIGDFIAQALVFWNPASQQCERNIYPAQPTSEGQCYGENFAEGVSWKISGKGPLPGPWSQWIIANILGGA